MICKNCGKEYPHKTGSYCGFCFPPIKNKVVYMNDSDKKPDEDNRPCPFCGGHELIKTDWWDDDGEYDALECAKCKAAAPADVWNKRVS